MPIPLSAGDRKLFLIAGGVFLLLVATAFILAKGPVSTDEIPTTYSVGSGGAKAAYLLLKASGYTVERWEQSPSELPEAAGATLILAEPSDAPKTEERTGLRQFVENGGHIIATGPFVGFFLPENGIVPDPLSGMTWKKLTALSPTSITHAAPEITLAPRAYWRPESSAVPFVLPLYGDGDKQMVVKYKFGKGEVIWWASATPLTNAGLTEHGNLEFFLACIGSEPQTRILWDEYFHGYRRSLTASIQSSPVKWIFLQLALFALAIVLTYSRRSGPISIPAGEIRLSPLEFVRTLGALYHQANAASVAVDISYHRFRYWLTRRLGMASNARVEDLERAIRERWNFQDANFSATVRDCASAPYDNTLKPRAALRLVRSLDDYAAKLKLFPKSGKEKN
ncbi:MAG: DUF4350 domain-containing protein [Acidobacteriia bacterium]|nr:DUF4350 domain-containing protein [Terriglobia bacterium]